MILLKLISEITGMISSLFAETGSQKTISKITGMISSVHVFADAGSQRTKSVITGMISSLLLMLCLRRRYQ